MDASFSAGEILGATNSLLRSGSTNDCKGRLIWTTDEIMLGDWFVAIPDQNNDPHDTLDLALSKGAQGVIVNRRSRYASIRENTVVISVPDTKVAVLDMVRYWRHSVSPEKVVGVAGSRGRRATMILLHQILSGAFRTHIAFMNNLGWFGCAREILSMPKDTELLIFEAGAIERGDIARIGGALDPDLAILTPIRHPLPSPERDANAASMYCELLETVSSALSTESPSAVIYDDNPAVQKRIDEILQDQTAQRYSLSGYSIAHRIAEKSLHELSNAMYATIGQPVTRAELWCAIEASKALELSTTELEQVLELPSAFGKSNRAGK